MNRCHSSLRCCALLLGAVVGCGSSTNNPGGTGATSDEMAGNGGSGTSAGAGVGNSGASTAAAGNGGALGSSGSGTGTSGASGANGGAAGANGGASGAGQAGSSAAGSPGATDYPYCNYGTVPSGTAPAAWVDNPTLTPTGVNPYGTPSTTIPGGYILLNEGPQGTTQVPSATESSILTRINGDLKFETAYTYIHLPPWTTGAKGTHYIDYLLVGTGLPNDPTTGGDSSYEGQYPDVETTSVAMTDMSQRYDLTHEFNHVLENSYGTILGTKVAWLQESYNDYLILLVAENANGATPGQAAQYTLPGNVGYLDVLVYQQPYVPIESCGVAVADASSVNGPEDYFTDITAYRYNDLFPLFVAQRVGQRFFSAVWEQAKTTEQVLQAMTRLLDKPRVQCMVGEYSARLALGDFGELSTSMQRVAGDPGMYMPTTTQAGWLVPSTTAKLPRYTGRNNIPITVSAGATQVSVNFMADATGSKATPEQMQVQLAYRATDGTVVFSPPVQTGMTSVTLTKPAKNNVVIAVITNITMDGFKTAKSYGWDPNETFGYKLQITGGTAAPTNKTYF
jgi:Family of unknown function (DUF6055)